MKPNGIIFLGAGVTLERRLSPNAKREEWPEIVFKKKKKDRDWGQQDKNEYTR